MKHIINEALLIVTVIFIFSLIKIMLDINFFGDKAIMLGLGLFIGESIYRLTYKSKLKREY
ncbi:hypothetical protein [Macrococcus animalis]|uniref:hypothetical protein n=1 Tax=Macrococcus animalis TaxID=3395467 RepID=UPI0039BE9C2E